MSKNACLLKRSVAMNGMISRTVTATIEMLKQWHLDRCFAAVMLGVLLLTTSIAPNQQSTPLGERIHQRLQETDQYSERPKTTGEFLEEARGDVPLDERLHNIARDSAEAMEQLGQEYTSGVKENLQSFKKSAEQIGRD
jgi:hypothetical protein